MSFKKCQVHPKYFRPNATITYKPLSKPPEAKQQQQQSVDMDAGKEVKKETEEDGVSISR